MARAKYGLDNPKKAAFLEWLLDPMAKGTQAEFGASIAVSPATLTKWKKAPEFRDAWSRELAKQNIDPGRIQKVLDALHKQAETGDVQAAKLYLQYVDRWQTPIQPEGVSDASQLSDDELDALIAETAQDERERRLEGSEGVL